jgi:hypothetical protein
MDYKHIDQIRSLASVQPLLRHEPMSRRERLERWAELLEGNPKRQLASLGEIEFRPRAERHAMRAENSPLSVAFDDPVLRLQGLRSDRLGDAMAFFELSEHEAHYLVCSCRHGLLMSAATAARSVRAVAENRVRSFASAWAVAGIALAIPSLLYLFI